MGETMATLVGWRMVLYGCGRDGNVRGIFSSDTVAHAGKCGKWTTLCTTYLNPSSNGVVVVILVRSEIFIVRCGSSITCTIHYRRYIWGRRPKIGLGIHKFPLGCFFLTFGYDRFSGISDFGRYNVTHLNLTCA